MKPFALIANPASGKYSAEQKKDILEPVRKLFGSEKVHGLDTESPEQFRECIADVGKKSACVVVAGGDGTFNDALNAPKHPAALAYLPLGSGNALRYALGYKGSLLRMAKRIKQGAEHSLDVILCNEKEKGFNASVGIEGEVALRSELYRKEGMSSMRAYFQSAWLSVFGGFQRPSATIIFDGKEAKSVSDFLTLTVMKLKYYGKGMQINPRAELADGRLHALCTNASIPEILKEALASWLGGSSIGEYHAASEIKVTTSNPLWLQIDGTTRDLGQEFLFRVLPKEVVVRY